MNLRCKLNLLLALSSMTGSCIVKAAGSPEKPNILFLIVDDWGAGDVDMCPVDVPYEVCPFRPTTMARRSLLNTPRIKQMASEGQILTNFYSPRAICSPSRAGFMTGRDPSRYGFVDDLYRVPTASSVRGGVTPNEKSFGKYLKEAGYSTGYSGKWHMGLGNGENEVYYTPLNHGFDETFFFVEGSNGETCEGGALNPSDDNNIYHACSYDHVQNCDVDTQTCEVVEQPIRWENVTARHLKSSLDYIEDHNNKEEPWVLWHAFLHVHIPWVPSRTFVTDPMLKHWTDMVGEVDWAVGVFLQKLKDLGADENTLVILTSDNGPYMESASTYCPQNCKILTPFSHDKVPGTFGCTLCDANSPSLPGPFSGGKGNTWEGGFRVPSVVWWPGTIPAGSINPMVTSGLDLLPTFVAASGGSLDESIAYDGKNILPALKSPPAPSSEPKGSFVYWCGMTPMAVRNGRYKVYWKSQDFVMETPNATTPEYMCAGTGKCCANSPTRLCSCFWGTDYNPPMVIDLLANVNEDTNLALDPNSSTTKAIVSSATLIRDEQVKSVAADREVKTDNLNTTEIIERLLLMTSYTQIDNPSNDNVIGIETEWFCKNNETGEYEFLNVSPNRTDYVPDQCQKEMGLKPSRYQNCTVQALQDYNCSQRLPCCEQEGYKGPFEYVVPEGGNVVPKDGSWESGDVKKCGCFNNGINSYFPDDEYLQESLCVWQNDVLKALEDQGLHVPYSFCRLESCPSKKANNREICNTIKQYGLDNVPTGNLFNSPYPDTQYSEKLRYPNQLVPPYQSDVSKSSKNAKHGKPKSSKNAKPGKKLFE